MASKENMKETNQGIPKEILDGIFSEDDKGETKWKQCSMCGNIMKRSTDNGKKEKIKKD